jgi:hypothetical protein
VSPRLNPVFALVLRRAAADSEVRERLSALLTLLLWAHFAAARVRNPRRPVWMRTTAPVRPARRARVSISGRRARG